MEKLYRKTVDVMGPLSKIIEYCRGHKRGRRRCCPNIYNDLLHYVEQTLQLLGQSSKAITYHTRLNVFGSVMNSQYQVKSMLKEKVSLIQNMTNIYSEKSSGTIFLTPSNPKDKQKDFHRTKYALFIKPVTRTEKI